MMERYIVQGGRRLRCGYTTGSCAAAAAAAATELLLTGSVPAAVRLCVPAGAALTLPVEDAHRDGAAAVCAVRKDAGDDPDVTHGIRIYVRATRGGTGVSIAGGTGVGRVTRAGLACAVGEAAINPAPRAQIAQAVRQVCARCGQAAEIQIVVSAENGAEIAKKTFNERLGIVGGISILGTSGLVEPMSEKALVDTIRAEIDSVCACGAHTLLLCPGNYGRDFARAALRIDLARAVTVSNFIGEALDYAAYKGVRQLLLIGHAGKLVKLAAGVMQTHSSMADARQEIFAAHAALCGAPQGAVCALMESVTVDGCLEILEQYGMRAQVMDSIGKKISFHLAQRTRGAVQAEALLFTNTYGEIWRSAGAQTLLAQFEEE